MRLVELPPLVASGACAILACAVPRRRRRASVSGSSASRIGAWISLRSASGTPRSCVCRESTSASTRTRIEPAQPGQQDSQRPVVVRVPRRPSARHSAAAFHDESKMAAIGLDEVLGIHGAAMVINQMHESHSPTHGRSKVQVCCEHSTRRWRSRSKSTRTLQGMARVRSGQAPAWPLISDRSVRRGSRVKRDFACTFTRYVSPVLVVLRSQSRLRLEGRTRTLSGPSPDLTSSVSGLLGDSAYVRQARSR